MSKSFYTNNAKKLFMAEYMIDYIFAVYKLQRLRIDSLLKLFDICIQTSHIAMQAHNILMQKLIHGRIQNRLIIHGI